MYYIQVTGDREWTDDTIVESALRTVMSGHDPSEVTVRHGNCRGLDKIAGVTAKRLGAHVDSMPAEWRKHEGCRCNPWRIANSYCSYAGPRRNRQMLDKPVNIVLAFHPNISESRGTKDCADEAVRRGMLVLLVDDTGTIAEYK